MEPYRPLFLLAYKSGIEGRIASRGNRTSGGCQASNNVTLTEGHALAKLRCVSIAPAHYIVRQCSAFFGGKSVLVLCEAFEWVVSKDKYTGAKFLRHLFAASYVRSPAFLCLSNVEMGGRNQDGNGQERCHCRDGTKADSPLHHFLLKACSSWGAIMLSWQSRYAGFVFP
jgi:hypothetical protein